MNMHVPHTPFSTPLSGSAKEIELRLKNIMSGPKKRPPVPFLALMFSVCIFCGNLVSCHYTTPEVTLPDLPQQEADPVAQKDPLQLTAQDLHPDLNQNGIPEEIRLVEPYGLYGSGSVEFWENDERFLWKSPGVCLYSQDGKDYLLSYTLEEYQGDFGYYYSVSDFSGEFEETLQSNAIRFDTNFNALFHKGFDPEEIAAFMDELNGLLANSIRLANVDGELAAEYCQPEDLPWLDGFPDVFTRDPEKSLLENLKAFQASMPSDLALPDPKNAETLIFDKSISMSFYSGAGGWQTDLTLHGDGTFQGDYCDADADVQYVCQFHGRFGDMVKLTENSWHLVLKELVLDTPYPVGKEWDEGDSHFISSEPYGFDGVDGKALQPGAEFVLYTPGATGYAPGSELYGAYDFWTWWPDRNAFVSAADTLGCYGLHNLETDYGFFSYNYTTSLLERSAP